MTSFFQTMFYDISTIWNGLSSHLQSFPISTIFLVIIILSVIVNTIKRILIWMERKRIKLHDSCQYLVAGSKGPDCDLPSRRKRFKKNNDSCAGCPGKSFKLTDAEAENRIACSSTWKRWILSLASYINAFLPYISFIYTLAVTIFENSK